MENKKDIKISLSTVFLIIALIIIAGMVYYIYIQKTNSNEKISTLEKNEVNMESQINDLQGKIDDMSNTTEVEDSTSNNTTAESGDEFAVLELEPVGEIAVLYNGEVYVNIDDSTLNIDYIYGDGKYQTLVKTRESYSEYQFDSLIVNNNNTKWLKLNISNVKAIYNNNYGQDISSENPKYGIIMLHEDNTVSYISISDLIEGKIETVKLDINNIINVVTEDNNGYMTYLIDSNGNRMNANNYIK